MYFKDLLIDEDKGKPLIDLSKIKRPDLYDAKLVILEAAESISSMAAASPDSGEYIS